MFENLKSSIERINYQPLSPFARNLVSLCEEAFEYVNDSDHKLSFTDPFDLKFRAKITTYLNKKGGFSERLKNIIEKHTGITVKSSKVQIFGQINAYMIPYFSTNDSNVIESMYRVMGKSKKEVKASDVPSIFKKVQDSVDLGRGTVKVPKDLYKFEICLAVELFLTEFHKRKDYQITPEMVAAIILHEVGHAVTMPELFNNAYYRATEAADSLKALAASARTVDANDYLSQARSVTDEMPDGGEKKDLISLIDSASDQTAEKKIPIAMAVFNARLHQIMHEVIAGIIRSLIASMVKSHADVAYRNYNVKTSDTVFTQRNSSVIERVADEYVSRHGMSRYISQTIPLFVKCRSKIWGGPIVNAAYLMLATMNEYWSAVFSPPMITPHMTTYDDMLTRSENIVSNIYASFKDQDISKEARDNMMEDLKASQEGLKKLKSIYSFRINSFIWKTLLRIAKPGSIAGAVRDANMARDYERLQVITKGMIRSPMYYQAARVKSLL